MSADFWEESTYYTGPLLTEAMVQGAEARLGYRLPAAYVAMLHDRNGGAPLRDCHPCPVATSWASDHVCLAGLKGIGGERGIDAPLFGSAALAKQYGLPPIGIVIGESPDSAYGAVMLDYRDCGTQGEPAVVHVEVKRGEPEITPLAGDFGTFVDGLRDAVHLGHPMQPVRWRSSPSQVPPALPGNDATAPPPRVPAGHDPLTGPKGLGGWLLLVGFGLVMAPYHLLLGLAAGLEPVTDPEVWSYLTTPSSERYDPALAAMIGAELVINLGLVALALVVAVKFLERSWRFPGLFISLLLALPLFTLADGVAAHFISPMSNQDAALSFGTLVAQVTSAVVWTAYTKKSRRVKNTFVRGRS